MDQRLKRAFLKHIDEQIRFFVLALEDMEYGLTTRDRQTPETEDRFWYGVQAALIAVGNVSKILWGQRAMYRTERAALREFLGIEEGSVLQPTTMRNHFEHFDERINWWYDTGEPFRSDRQIAGIPPYREDKTLQRWIEHETLVISFNEDKWDFIAISVELLRIEAIIDDYPLEGWYPLENE